MAGDQRGRGEGKEMSRIANGHGLCPGGSGCRVLPFPCPTACLQPCRAAARLRALVLDVSWGSERAAPPCVHQFSSPRRSLPRRNPLSNEYLLGVTAGREAGAPHALPRGVSRRYPPCSVFLPKARRCHRVHPLKPRCSIKRGVCLQPQLAEPPPRAQPIAVWGRKPRF